MNECVTSFVIRAGTKYYTGTASTHSGLCFSMDQQVQWSFVFWGQARPRVLWSLHFRGSKSTLANVLVRAAIESSDVRSSFTFRDASAYSGLLLSLYRWILKINHPITLRAASAYSGLLLSLYRWVLKINQPITLRAARAYIGLL